MNKNYDNLHKISRQARVLSGIASLLDWDQETFMPPAAADIRSEQLETLAGLIHDQSTGPQFKHALEKLIDIDSGKILDETLSDEQKAAVKYWRKDFRKETLLPKEFVEEWARTTSKAILAWRSAKQKNAFHEFAPILEKLVTLARRKADYLGYKEHPYDALLEQYEHDITSKEVSELFQNLRKNLTILLKKIKSSKQIDDSFLKGNFSKEKQLSFGHTILNAMGYDFSRGRMDLSSHPFSSSAHPTDSRITTRIHPNSLISSISVALHEGGHSLYEMGLPLEHYGSPLGEAISLGMHESQSRWWETRIGQSKSFWDHFFPKIKAEFPEIENATSLSFYRAINKVEPSLIRVDADEVTYALHVILRFELEMALIEGTLSVWDLPKAWNEKMEELLGVTPPDDTNGCLQDIHWSMGAFGYFPTYALGNMYASHLFQAFEEAHPDWEKRTSNGELLFIKNWLHENVYRHGRRYSSKELLHKATGKPFTSDAFIHYLNTKYKDIYHL